MYSTALSAPYASFAPVATEDPSRLTVARTNVPVETHVRAEDAGVSHAGRRDLSAARVIDDLKRLTELEDSTKEQVDRLRSRGWSRRGAGAPASLAKNLMAQARIAAAYLPAGDARVAETERACTALSPGGGAVSMVHSGRAGSAAGRAVVQSLPECFRLLEEVLADALPRMHAIKAGFDRESTA